QGAEKDETADEIGPESERPETRKGEVARTKHLREQKYAHCLDGGHGEQEHHHRAVHGEELIVCILIYEIVSRNGQLDTHEQRKHAREDEKEECRADIEE